MSDPLAPADPSGPTDSGDARHLPELIVPRSPSGRAALTRAAYSPTAVVATAAGAGIGALDRSAVVAVILAAVGWSGRMVAALVAGRRRERAAEPHPADVDPWSVPEPWRQLLQQSAAAQTRFDQTVAGWPPGPTRDRLATFQPRVYAEVASLVTLARRGAAAAGWTGATVATGRPTADALAAELRHVQSSRQGLDPSAAPRAAELSRREEAIAAQLRALRRAESASAALHDELRVAVARLDQSISELLILDVSSRVDRAVDPAGLTNALDQLSDGISSLRAALEETTGDTA